MASPITQIVGAAASAVQNIQSSQPQASTNAHGASAAAGQTAKDNVTRTAKKQTGMPTMGKKAIQTENRVEGSWQKSQSPRRASQTPEEEEREQSEEQHKIDTVA